MARVQVQEKKTFPPVHVLLKTMHYEFHVAVVQKTAKKGNREHRNARTDLLLFVILFFFHVFGAPVIIIKSNIWQIR